MDKTAIERFSSAEDQLFTRLFAYLLILGLWICAVAPTELVHPMLGPLSWGMYFLLNAVACIVLLLLLGIAKRDEAINKLLDLAERRIKTPCRLQSGYVWLRGKSWAIIPYFGFVAFISVVGFGGGVSQLQLEEMEYFLRSPLSLAIIYGFVFPCLLLGSWIAGLLVGESKGNVGPAIQQGSEKEKYWATTKRA